MLNFAAVSPCLASFFPKAALGNVLIFVQKGDGFLWLPGLVENALAFWPGDWGSIPRVGIYMCILNLTKLLHNLMSLSVFLILWGSEYNNLQQVNLFNTLVNKLHIYCSWFLSSISIVCLKSEYTQRGIARLILIRRQS
jgi:hypothetical protein